MGDKDKSSVIGLIARDVPGLALAVVGYGCTLLSIESNRLSAIQTVGTSNALTSYASLTAFAIFIFAMAIMYGKAKKGLRDSTVFIIIFGIITSISMFSSMRQGVWEESSIVILFSPVIFRLSEGILLFLWIKTLLPYGAKAMALVFALATIVVALLNCSIAFLKTEAAISTVCLLPLFAAVLLCYFREYSDTRRLSRNDIEEESPSPGSYSFKIDAALLVPNDSTEKGRIIYTVTLMVSLFCYALNFGQIHFKWVSVQDGATISLIIQLGTAIGTACGGLCIFVLIRHFWNRRTLELYKVFLLPTVLLALWLSSMAGVSWVFLYLVLLNITQKLVSLLIVLTPFLIKNKPPYLLPWIFAFGSFFAGRVLSSFLDTFPPPDYYNVASAITLMALFVCSVIISLSGSVSDYQAERISNAYGPPDKTTYAINNKLQKACQTLAFEHRLTNREREILLLLARGRTAQHIAESLVITQSTAKTHLRNIYSKMGVHTQQELINLAENTIDQQRIIEKTT